VIPQSPEASARRPAILGLLAVGLLVWALCLGCATGSLLQWAFAGVLVVLLFFPPLGARIEKIIAATRKPTPRRARWIALAVAVCAVASFLITAYVQSWDFILRFQDEHSYALQLQMLAHGRLWMPPLDPRIADFFSSLNIFVRPVYGSIYFPGTALMFVTGVWLHLPFWVLPLIAGGACVGLTYLILRELLDGSWALPGAVMLAALPKFRSVSLMLLSQTPLLLLGLLLILAWLTWRRKPSLYLATVIGLLAGWAAVTRPLDAICFAVPVGVAMLFDLRNRRAPGPIWLGTTFCIFAGAAPFLALQAVQNHGMTGRWTRFPIDQYHAETYPAPLFGFHAVNWAAAPTPTLPEDADLMRNSAWPMFRAHTLGHLPSELWRVRLPRTLLTDLPAAPLACLLPVGFLALKDRRRIVLAATPILFFVLYVPYIFYQEHYLVVVAPGLILLALLGLRMIARAWPGDWLEPALLLLALGLSLGAFAQTDEQNWAPWMDLVRIEQRLQSLPNEPALVFFRYHRDWPDVNISFHEPVYNVETPLPEDATIVRAHDWGARNVELIRYFAAVQPQRQVYLYDRLDDSITPVGTAGELEHNPGWSLK
jgi:hypothetical protein